MTLKFFGRHMRSFPPRVTRILRRKRNYPQNILSLSLTKDRCLMVVRHMRSPRTKERLTLIVIGGRRLRMQRDTLILISIPTMKRLRRRSLDAGILLSSTRQIISMENGTGVRASMVWRILTTIRWDLGNACTIMDARVRKPPNAPYRPLTTRRRTDRRPRGPPLGRGPCRMCNSPTWILVSRILGVMEIVPL